MTSNVDVEKSVSFRINGKWYTVTPGQSEHATFDSVLVDFIRGEASLPGTKYMCREGGCGACVVSAVIKDLGSGEKKTVAVNACLVPVFSCDGWDITTIEGLGNARDGYDVLQNRMVGFSGTQCGYCTPGMIMNMHALMKANSELTMKEIEDALDGNICRCTGFRPIMDAFKSVAVDVPDAIKKKCAEIEESTGKVCPMKGACCSAGRCLKSDADPAIEECYKKKIASHIDIVAPRNGARWVKPVTLKEALTLLGDLVRKGVTYRVVAGNTSTGIYKDEGPFPVYVDVKGLAELQAHDVQAKKVVLGGGATLSFAIAFLNKVSKISGFEYGAEIAKHAGRVANTAVRNVGTLAGNLMIKHAHHDFPSDIFVTLEGLGAKLNIASAGDKSTSVVSLLEFLKLDMRGRLIASIELPALPAADGYVVRRFKITKRYQNAHAYVNAAFMFRLEPGGGVVVKERPSICFGGINPSFVHASKTETFLTGKSLADPRVVQQAVGVLEDELEPDYKPPDATPEYRKTLARNLLYKTILGIVGGQAAPKLRTGGTNIEYKVFSGKQTYDTHKDQWPLTQPVPKLEGTSQCSGEAEYTNDIPKQPNELFGAFVLATRGNCDLKDLDPSEALKVPGVVAFISAKDIPGKNDFQTVSMFPTQGPQEIFASSKILAAGQSVGMILAETRSAAFAGAKLVRVITENAQAPVVGVRNAIAAAKQQGYYEKAIMFRPKSMHEPPSPPSAIKHRLEGQFSFHGQSHFAIEPHVTLVIPKEGGLDVYSATQSMDAVQAAIAQTLLIPNNAISVHVRRLGGGFGSKGSAAAHVASAAGIGAYVTGRPVRVVLDIETSFKMTGKRVPTSFDYKVGFDDEGNILSMEAEIISDAGALANDSDIILSVLFFQNAYRALGWSLAGGVLNTNTAPNTYCRAPGSTYGIAAIETVLEHIAHYLRKDPLEVRLTNLIREGDETLGIPGLLPASQFKGENIILRLVDEIKANADYVQRKAEVAEFNSVNRWRKRGLAAVPMRYPQHFLRVSYPSFVAIYHVDGTVAVSSGGIEMGQGLNTKVAQSAAYTLGVPLDKVRVKPANNLISANGAVSGGAITSELVAWSTAQACKQLVERLAPFREKLGGSDASWEEIVKAAHAAGVDLKATYQPSLEKDDNLRQYDIWGLNLTEVELDVLTGEYKIRRVDLIEDVGKSMSPEVDVGQVEGSLVFGLGLWTTERLQYDADTGELLTNNTWEYKTPFAKDIPENLRVTLLTNTSNEVGVHGSKAVGEPPVCISVAVIFALKNAIDSARADAGITEHYQIETPLSPENVLKYTAVSREHLHL